MSYSKHDLRVISESVLMSTQQPGIVYFDDKFEKYALFNSCVPASDAEENAE